MDVIYACLHQYFEITLSLGEIFLPKSKISRESIHDEQIIVNMKLVPFKDKHAS